LATIPPPEPAKAVSRLQDLEAQNELDADDAEDEESAPATADRIDTRPPPPGKTNVAAQNETQPPHKVRGLLDEEDDRPRADARGLHPIGDASLSPPRGGEPLSDEDEEPPGETEGPKEQAPKIAPVLVSKQEPAEAPKYPTPPSATSPSSTSPSPTPPPQPSPQSPPPAPKPAATGLTDAERLQLLEDRFLRGEITELTYRELRDKLGKK
jgi:hypothetical protein